MRINQEQWNHAYVENENASNLLRKQPIKKRKARVHFIGEEKQPMKSEKKC